MNRNIYSIESAALLMKADGLCTYLRGKIVTSAVVFRRDLENKQRARVKSETCKAA